MPINPFGIRRPNPQAKAQQQQSIPQPGLADLFAQDQRGFLSGGNSSAQALLEAQRAQKGGLIGHAQLPGGFLAANLAGFGQQGVPIGLTTLNQILASQGATDPNLLNRQLSDIGLGTQAQQTTHQGNLSRLGLSGSGVGQAISASIGQAGAEQRGQAIAQETAQTEARRRQDLQLLSQLLIGPSTDFTAIAAGVPPAGQQPSDLEKGLGFATGIIDAIIPL